MSGLRASHVGPRDWDAEAYDRVSDPQYEWAKEVMARLDLRGDEVVLDAGCGSGRVTALLEPPVVVGSQQLAHTTKNDTPGYFAAR